MCEESAMLHIYVAEHCPGSPTARIKAERLRERAPEIPVEVVDIDAHGAVVPPVVFGTLTYTWDDQIIFLGNPSDQELLERVRSLHERAAA
jgi:hypothetical protein